MHAFDPPIKMGPKERIRIDIERSASGILIASVYYMSRETGRKIPCEIYTCTDERSDGGIFVLQGEL
jgi:hypothetical protein